MNIEVLDASTKQRLRVIEINDWPRENVTEVLVELPVRRVGAYCVTHYPNGAALFLTLPRALEYAALHHGQIEELFK